MFFFEDKKLKEFLISSPIKKLRNQLDKHSHPKQVKKRKT